MRRFGPQADYPRVGRWGAEGLGAAATAGEDILQMPLARSLAEKIDDTDMQRS